MLFGRDMEWEIAKQSLEALEENKNIPHIFAPYCSVSINSTKAELDALRRSVEIFGGKNG